MSDDTKSPAQETSEQQQQQQQQIAPQTGELNAEQLDRISGGGAPSGSQTASGVGGVKPPEPLGPPPRP